MRDMRSSGNFPAAKSSPAKTCAPNCFDDTLCTTKKYTYCLKRPYVAPYGVCVTLP